MEGAAASALDPRASPRCLRATDGSPRPSIGLRLDLASAVRPPPANRCFDLASTSESLIGPRLRRPAASTRTSPPRSGVSAWTSPPLGPSGLPASAANTEAEQRGGYGPVSLPRTFCLRPPVSAFDQTSRGQRNQRSDATVRNGGKEGRVGRRAGMFVVRRAPTLRLQAVRGYSGGYASARVSCLWVRLSGLYKTLDAKSKHIQGGDLRWVRSFRVIDIF